VFYEESVAGGDDDDGDCGIVIVVVGQTERAGQNNLGRAGINC
jgi:hypothetical protein